MPENARNARAAPAPALTFEHALGVWHLWHCLAFMALSGIYGIVWHLWHCLAFMALSGIYGIVWNLWHCLAFMALSGIYGIEHSAFSLRHLLSPPPPRRPRRAHKKMPCTPRRAAATGLARQGSSSQVILMHASQARLWLLPSRPDQVRGATLQRAQPSTLPARRVDQSRQPSAGNSVPL